MGWLERARRPHGPQTPSATKQPLCCASTRGLKGTSCPPGRLQKGRTTRAEGGGAIIWRLQQMIMTRKQASSLRRVLNLQGVDADPTGEIHQCNTRETESCQSCSSTLLPSPSFASRCLAYTCLVLRSNYLQIAATHYSLFSGRCLLVHHLLLSCHPH